MYWANKAESMRAMAIRRPGEYKADEWGLVTILANGSGMGAGMDEMEMGLRTHSQTGTY